MELSQIAAFIIFGLTYLLIVPLRWRKWILLVASIIAIYWLQPTLNIRWLDYSLPTATLGITIICWLFTRPENSDNSRVTREDYSVMIVIAATSLILTISRYVELPITFTSRPPDTWHVALYLIGLVSIVFVLRNSKVSDSAITVAMILLIALFILLKTEMLTVLISGVLRRQTGQDVTLASAVDIQWLGLSYVVFRLIHTMRDRQNGLLPSLSLGEYVTYVIFFPSYTAGPIDRVERFVSDFRALEVLNGRDAQRISVALSKVVIGLVKKFIVADSLAFFSLNITTFNQTHSALAVWVMLYSYAIRLYFDFSGYSDIAIGIGMLFGIQLPENFDQPYLKNNITAFWQSWHITLSNWVRSYVYSPLSRSLLRRKNKPSTYAIILICTLATMLVIGLWHGVSIPFALWGLWHGIGLFIHKLWSDRTRGWYRGLKQHPFRLQLWQKIGIVVTFHFILLGWVWFAMPDLGTATRVFTALLGIIQ